MHISVLKDEIIEAFAGQTLTVFVDATLGAGGHAAAILAAHPEIKQYIGIDQDPQAQAIAAENLALYKEKVLILSGNFSEILPQLKNRGISSVDGILFDLGVSSMQFDIAEKGFSFNKEGPLDMRMDPTSPLTAEEIVNEWDEREIGRIFRVYGEEKRWRVATKTLMAAREKERIITTTQLTAVLRPVLENWKEKIHPLTRVFQALRIAVNRELDVLETAMPLAIDLLSPQGRLAVISFHSLEDRIVKTHFRHAASDKMDTEGIGVGLFIDKDPIVNIITTKPMIPTDTEIAANPRSRSAKLRVVEKR